MQYLLTGRKAQFLTLADKLKTFGPPLWNEVFTDNVQYKSFKPHIQSHIKTPKEKMKTCFGNKTDTEHLKLLVQSKLLFAFCILQESVQEMTSWSTGSEASGYAGVGYSPHGGSGKPDSQNLLQFLPPLLYL